MDVILSGEAAKDLPSVTGIHPNHPNLFRFYFVNHSERLCRNECLLYLKKS